MGVKRKRWENRRNDVVSTTGDSPQLITLVMSARHAAGLMDINCPREARLSVHGVVRMSRTGVHTITWSSAITVVRAVIYAKLLRLR